jgi:sugar O-acyltransferase (sialic acid O-acetyltransferase NeuD family)
MSVERVVVIGAGGHGKVIVSTLLEADIEVTRILDDDAAKHGSRILGIPVHPLAEAAGAGELAILGIGTNDDRKRLAESMGFDWATVVHPQAWVHAGVRLGAGSVVFAGAVIQPGTTIGKHVIINTGALIDHDCEVGDYAHVAPGAQLAGGVRLGEGAFLGIGCCAVPGVRIGDWATVGAGAVVTNDVAAGDTVVGVPAKPLRKKG